jgi:hypothetical protein
MRVKTCRRSGRRRRGAAERQESYANHMTRLVAALHVLTRQTAAPLEAVDANLFWMPIACLDGKGVVQNPGCQAVERMSGKPSRAGPARLDGPTLRLVEPCDLGVPYSDLWRVSTQDFDPAKRETGARVGVPPSAGLQSASLIWPGLLSQGKSGSTSHRKKRRAPIADVQHRAHDGGLYKGGGARRR